MANDWKMLCEVYDLLGNERIDTVYATPKCGEDFCDHCGDCLSCYIGDHCYDGGDEHLYHRWIHYGPLDETFMENRGVLTVTQSFLVSYKQSTHWSNLSEE